MQAALLEQHISPEQFWSHLVPLATDIKSVRELAELALLKTLGRREAVPRVGQFRNCLSELMNAFATILPRLSNQWETAVEPFRQRWNYHGPGLLGRIVELTEPGILVDAATVVMVYPALRGGGAAHLPYNLLHIEVQTSDPVVQLPEVVRLAWLLSTLNLDLPRYSEGVQGSRLATVAGLAMIPITLTAAAEVQLAPCDTEALGVALPAWLAPVHEADSSLDILTQWWETYRALRPSWATGLQALDRLLDGTGNRPQIALQEERDAG